MQEPKLSLILNYFNPTQNPRIDLMTQLAAEHLDAFTRSDHEIIIADGTGFTSPFLVPLCESRNWRYSPAAEKQPFAAGYNRGASLATGTHIVWIANDILVQSDWDARLLRELNRTGAWMAQPYLSYSDYWGQIRGHSFRNSTFYPSFLTFNLNLLTRHCWQTVGPIDEQFSGCFNDLDYLIRIRDFGGDVIIADAGNIAHLGKITLHVKTDLNPAEDRKRFYQKYPNFPSQCAFTGTDPILCRSSTYRVLLAATHKLPESRLTDMFRETICRLEPLFHRARSIR